MRLMLALALAIPFALPVVAAEPLRGYADQDGSLDVLTSDGSLISLKPIAFGPNWSWVGLKGKLGMDGVASVSTSSGKIGEIPISVTLRTSQVGPRSLRVEAFLHSAGTAPCTLVAVSLVLGKSVTGPAQIVSPQGSISRPLPLGKEALGDAVTAVRFPGGMEVAFAAPTSIAADNEARVILVKDALTSGTTTMPVCTITMPEDLTWYGSPDQVPDPANQAQWFPWTSGNAWDDMGALGLEGWLPPITAPVVRQGEQLMVDGKPARFWGINVSYAHCAPTKDVAVARANMYAKYGYNAVRFHKYAQGAGWAGILSKTSIQTFDPDALDRMDYQVAEFAKRGIRIKLSPNFGQELGPDDRARVPYLEELGASKNGGVFAKHGTLWFSRELQDLQIEQIVALLKHRNPYTGKTYAEDPAVMLVECYNEDSALFYGTMGALKKSKTLRERAGALFGEWLMARYGSEEGLKAAWGPTALGYFVKEGLPPESLSAHTVLPAGNPWFYDREQVAGSQAAIKVRMADTTLFLHEMQNGLWARFRAAFREAGYQGEIISSNWIAGQGASHFYNLASDATLGIIDRHNYFPGQASMLTNAGSGLLSMGFNQVAGMPFSLSEWISPRPNEQVIEGPAIIGAYGMGLQGWDVSYMFQNGDEAKFRSVLYKEEFDVVTPHTLGLSAIVARQVLRGDVTESAAVAPLNIHVPSLHAGKVGFLDEATAVGDVKSQNSDAVPAATLAVQKVQVRLTEQFEQTPRFDLAAHRKDGALVSSTGQLRWYEGTGIRTGFFTMDTLATKAVVGFAEGKEQRLGPVTITSRTPFAAIYVTAAERTDTDLTKAKRVLIAAVARARNTGQKLIEKALLRPGKGPILMEPVRAEITIPGSWTLRPLDHDGRPVGEGTPVSGAFTVDGAVDKAIHWELRR